MTSLSADGLATLRDENRRLRALVDFGRQVTAERDLRSQLRLLCAELLRTTGCSAAAVILYDPEHGGVELIETAGLTAFVDAEWQQAVRTAPTGTELANVVPAGAHRLGAVPLLVADDRLGVVLTYDCQPGDAADEEVRYVAAMADAAAMAILNTRLYAHSRRELRRRDALRKVVASISSELDLDSLLGRVVGSAVALLEADSGVISLIDREGAARIRAIHNLPDCVVGSVLPPGAGISGQVLATHAGVVVEHYLQDIPHPLAEAGRVECGVAVPVWWQGQLTGVFGVLARDPSRVFNAQDREVMELLANHLAIAIENARLYGEVRDRLAEVTGLQAASSALAGELLPERALRVIAQQALSLSGAATVSIELLRSGCRELEVQVAVGEHAAELAAMRVAVEGSLAGAAVSTGRPQILRAPFGNVAERSEVSVAAERAEARSLLVLPLRARSRTLGTLSAYTHHPNAFHSRQVELLAAFANQAAISLDNARLYGELQSRLEEMVGLQRLGTLLLEEHDFDRVLQSICQQLLRLTDAGGVGLALLEDDPRFLEMRTVVGPSADVLRGSRIPTEGSFAAEALRSNRSQRSDDAQNDPRGYRQSLVLGNTHTILSVPMKTRLRTVGVLSVYNKEGEGGFTDRDAELATFFANQAAAAIENARLYEQTREYAVVEERNRLARDLHDSVTQSLFSVTLLSEAALNLLDRDDPAKARERLERANELAQGALAEMRALIFQLRPMTLQEEGLLSAVKKHLSALRSRNGQLVGLQVTGAERRLPAAVEDAAFGIIQESLNNVVKHANCPHAQVHLDFGADCLRVTTIDTGVGFDMAAPRPVPTLGMSTMRERAEGISGRLVVESAPGRGTSVCAELPVHDAD
ncbi:MAG: GAF domain-containing protein [Chloroflexota bacterium]